MPEEEEKKSKGGRGYRMRKFFASKAAGTSAGRKVILSFLGDEGEALLHALKHSAIRFDTKKKGKQLKKDIMKIVLKAKLASDEKRIETKDTKALQEPLNGLALKLLKALRDEPGEINTAPIVADMKVVSEGIVGLMTPHMKEKNVNKLKGIFEFYGNPDYLNAILNNPEYDGERSALKFNLGNIVHTHLHELSVQAMERRKCVIKACPLLCAVAKGDFLGSEYCGRHHVEHVQSDLKEPRLLNFTNPSTRQSTYLVGFLRTLDDAAEAESADEKAVNSDGHGKWVNLYHFHDVLVQYKRLRSNVRKSRAQVINRKFIRTRQIEMPDDMRATINADLSKGGQATLHHVFDALLAHVVQQLEGQFEPFLKSDQFQAYKASITIPQDLVDAADRRRSSLMQAPPSTD